MCGIAGQLSLDNKIIDNLDRRLQTMSKLLVHRGPDGSGIWKSSDSQLGFAHRRLSIIDLSKLASQPMEAKNGTVLTFNGEIYNFLELREELRRHWSFCSNSDSECILASFNRFGEECLNKLRGMFAFAIWDTKNKKLFCARDRFGIKPLYYTIVDNIFYFASEAKALLPFVKTISTNNEALAEYLTFQYTIGEKTMFDGIFELLPGHALTVKNSKVKIWRYWDVRYEIDYNNEYDHFQKRLVELLDDSINLHTRSDVEIASYVSGGIDSSLIYQIAQGKNLVNSTGFHGKFSDFQGYDESNFAHLVTDQAGGTLSSININASDFSKYIGQVIYQLDFPVAGPGSFAQFMVSKHASESFKVMLGGQGGDEIFGGYARYLIAYFEQCIKAAIDGQYKNGNFIVTIESIIPNLGLLREYKPLIKKFWSDGLFESMDKRYFSLIDRSADMKKEIDWNSLDMGKVFSDFSFIFNNPSNVKKEAYFDKMTHFDFKCLLPALLQVEDRMSMAHGIESRVPLLDHPLIEFAATIPANIKFDGGNMKHLIKKVFKGILPKQILERRDKMGFPVPLKQWFSNELKEFVLDNLREMAFKKRPHINSKSLLENFGNEAQFSRKTWALLSLELWYQQFHDKSADWKF